MGHVSKGEFLVHQGVSNESSLKMATGPGRGDVPAITDPELWREQQRFFNFLQHYDLHKYHQRFLRMGVRRISHFKDVSDADLDAVGLTPPEKTRLRKKLDENFSTTGKLKVSYSSFANQTVREPCEEGLASETTQFRA